jgi:hypothetical protein
MKQKLAVFILCGLVLAMPAVASVLFTLDPANGIVAGAAGSSVGWGYTVSTDSGFVAIDSISFVELSGFGTFTAFVPSEFASPGLPISSPFFPGSSGLEYDIDPGATVGAASQGTMVLYYDWYSDLNFDQNTVEYLGLGPLNASAEVDVNGPATNVVPEPAGGALFALGAGALAWLGRRRARAGSSAS